MDHLDRHLLETAIGYSVLAHDGQVRKGTTTPYHTHPVRAAIQASKDGRSIVVCQALALHDVVEDTEKTIEDIQSRFCSQTTHIVNGLTDVYTKEAYPNMTRAQRKLRENKRLSMEWRDVKISKMYDIQDNMNEPLADDSMIPWRIRWLKEKLATLVAISHADELMADRLINQARKQLNELQSK